MWWTGRKVLAAIGLVGAFGLGGCAYDDGYGYGGVGVGVGSGYYGGYYDSPYYGYGPGAYNGWYDNWYYPGTGYYVYDRQGRRQRWSDGQRRYWEGRRGGRPDRGWAGRPRDRDNDGRPDWRGRDRDNDGRPDWRNRDGRNWRDRNNDGRPDWGNGRPDWGNGQPGRRPDAAPGNTRPPQWRDRGNQNERPDWRNGRGGRNWSNPGAAPEAGNGRWRGNQPGAAARPDRAPRATMPQRAQQPRGMGEGRRNYPRRNEN